MTPSWTITRWLAPNLPIAALCSGLLVGAVVLLQQRATLVTLAESRAQETSRQVFEHLYAAMRHGAAVNELDDIVARLNQQSETSVIRLIRGEPVARQYGDTPVAQDLRTADPQVATAFARGEPVSYRDGDALRSLHPVVLKAECSHCHAGTPGTTVNGLVDVYTPLAAMQRPLAFLTDTAFLGFLGAQVLVFAALFVAVRTLVVRPVHALADTMSRQTAADAPLQPVDGRGLRARELHRLATAFNRLMGSLARQRADLVDKAAALSDARDAAEAARRHADAANLAKTDFLASMSHELRTPLNAVLGFSEIMRDEVFGPLGNPRYRHYASDIHASAAHLRDLVNDLLDLARLDAGDIDLTPEPLDVCAEIDACLRLFRSQAADRGVAVKTGCKPGLPVLVADRRALRQVLYNLISNAIKYTPAGGLVRIAAHGLADRIEIVVSDTGVGIAQDLEDLVFAARGRVLNVDTRRIEGTGLGLSLVKALMDLHGGTVALDSRPGYGATFTLGFPRRCRVAVVHAEEADVPAAGADAPVRDRVMAVG